MEQVEQTNKTVEILETTQTVQVEHKLTDDELRENGLALASQCIKKALIESEKKAANAAFGQQLSAVQELIDSTTEILDSGVEERFYDCKVEKDWEKLEKRYYDVQTNDLIDTKPFTGEDHQIAIGDTVPEDSEDASELDKDDTEDEVIDGKFQDELKNLDVDDTEKPDIDEKASSEED